VGYFYFMEGFERKGGRGNGSFPACPPQAGEAEILKPMGFREERSDDVRFSPCPQLDFIKEPRVVCSKHSLRGWDHGDFP
jgi:hypothetical protein